MKYNYMRSAIYNSAKTGQINLVLAYNGKLNNTMLAELAHSFEQELLARLGTAISPYAHILEWVQNHFGFSKYNHPSRNADIERKGEWINYNAEGCSGGFEANNTILRIYS